LATEALKWQEYFSVGHPALDAEHRSMVDAINAICECEHARGDESDLRLRCETLRTLSSSHFEHEERVLGEIRSFAQTEPEFPVSMKSMSEAMFIEHLRDHQHAIDALRLLLLRSGDRGLPICDDLTRWFVEHAIKYDAQLKAVLRGIQDDWPVLFRKIS